MGGNGDSDNINVMIPFQVEQYRISVINLDDGGDNDPYHPEISYVLYIYVCKKM